MKRSSKTIFRSRWLFERRVCRRAEGKPKRLEGARGRNQTFHNCHCILSSSTVPRTDSSYSEHDTHHVTLPQIFEESRANDQVLMMDLNNNIMITLARADSLLYPTVENPLEPGEGYRPIGKGHCSRGDIVLEGSSRRRGAWIGWFPARAMISLRTATPGLRRGLWPGARHSGISKL